MAGLVVPDFRVAGVFEVGRFAAGFFAAGFFAAERSRLLPFGVVSFSTGAVACSVGFGVLSFRSLLT